MDETRNPRDLRTGKRCKVKFTEIYLVSRLYHCHRKLFTPLAITNHGYLSMAITNHGYLSMAIANPPCARHSLVSSVNYRVHCGRARRNFQSEGSKKAG